MAIDGLVKLVPVPKDVPPFNVAYHLTIPEDALAPKLTAPVPQRLLGVEPVIAGSAFTVAVTAVLDVETH